eukprot:5707893-Prymnesium_polylepis.1
MSQRCSWLYLAAQLDFVRSLAKLSEAVYTPGGSAAPRNRCRLRVPAADPASPALLCMAGGTANARRPDAAAAKRRLRALLGELSTPPLAYVPLCRSSARFCPVLRIPPEEASVFVTRARASALLCVEVE